VKHSDPKGNPKHAAEQEAYAAANPHSGQLMEIFKRARIEYGRIDYCIVDGYIEVFEVNTNPSVLSDPPTAFDLIDSQPFADQHAAAFRQLAGATIEENLANSGALAIRQNHEEVLAALKRKFSRRRAKRALRLAVSQLFRRLSQ